MADTSNKLTFRLSDNLLKAINKECELSDNDKASNIVRQLLIEAIRERRVYRKLSDKIENGHTILNPKTVISATDIKDTIRELAVRWGDGYHMTMIDKFKLASDIQNVFLEFLRLEEKEFNYPTVPLKK